MSEMTDDTNKYVYINPSYTFPKVRKGELFVVCCSASIHDIRFIRDLFFMRASVVLVFRRLFYRGRGLGRWTERYQEILLFWLLLLVL